MSNKRVLSGMQPSGKLHLGNWLGALKNWVKLQHEYESFFFIADWHALSTNYEDTSRIRENVFEMAVDWVAAGLDPEKSVIFLQSGVLEHAELHVLLSMMTPVSWLERNPTYKDQQQQITGRDLATYGFLGYPVLQAADILIYRANCIPVGIDQLPHLELTREICRRFNTFYGDVFPEPQPLLAETAKVPGLDGRKMSKSYGNTINLSDTPEEIRQKVMTMVTDPQRIKRTDVGNPEVCGVYSFHKIFSSKDEQAEVAEGCRTAGIGCIDCKKRLLANLMAELTPIQEKRNELVAAPDKIRAILDDGAGRARKAAQETMQAVRESMKLYV
ncbi:MAG: tryptophan--tRNA ligase [Nitrospirota bacterium]|nr:tryptophan--tRNA ligase [Nitrospirota bacterium]